MSLYVFACVNERGRERQREREKERSSQRGLKGSEAEEAKGKGRKNELWLKVSFFSLFFARCSLLSKNKGESAANSLLFFPSIAINQLPTPSLARDPLQCFRLGPRADLVMTDLRWSGVARSRRDSAKKAPAFSFEEDEVPKKPKQMPSLASTSTSAVPAHDDPNPTFSSLSSSLSLLLYEALLKEELKESSQKDKSIFLGLFFLAASSFAAAARPDLVVPAFLLFASTALPARAVSFARRKWGYFMFDFCYFANAAVAAWLLIGEERGIGGMIGEEVKNNVKAAIVALAEGPLAAAAIAWRCSWCPGMTMSHLVSTLVHVLPGAALFSRELVAVAAAAGGRGEGKRFFSREEPEQQPKNFLWLLQYQFVAPLCFYIAWQLLYFLVVQVVCRESILRDRHDTSYRCLARRAARADNFWNLIVRGQEPCEVTGSMRPAGSSSQVDEKLGLKKGTTVARRCLAYGGVQLAFTISTLTTAALVTSHRTPWTLWQAFKFAVSLWYGVEAASRARRRAAEGRVERAVVAAAAAVK